ncbi:hypothetical protein AVEN_122098-1 [Araneus ventricosus]|uniref:Uncharacterized protein n=1 Tax=Araneus ventricosus TaxID=182803 RepID=A0A4Y2S6H4_ARAVE|nr:hypothetical protein AVEN_122098-1 [Araneus ventricosus]
MYMGLVPTLSDSGDQTFPPTQLVWHGSLESEGAVGCHPHHPTTWRDTSLSSPRIPSKWDRNIWRVKVDQVREILFSVNRYHN